MDVAKLEKEKKKEQISPPARPPHNLHRGEPVIDLLLSC